MGDIKKDLESNAIKLFHKYNAEGDKLVAKGDHELAREKYQKALLCVPENLSVRHKAAELLLKMDRKQDALSEYQFIASKALAISSIILDQIKIDGSKSPQKPDASESDPSRKIEDNSVTLGFYQVPLFADLSPMEFFEILKNLDVVLINKGEKFIHEGEVGDSMFILISGKVEIVREHGHDPEKEIIELSDGSFFGEMSLVAETPRLASVVAKTDCTLLKISRGAYLKIILQYPNIGETIKSFHRERLLKNLLWSSPIFSRFNDETIHAIIEKFELEHVLEGTVLLEQGQEGDGFYLLLRGSCEVIVNDENGAPHTYSDMVEGDFFGEISLLLRIPVTATVRAKKDTVIMKMTLDDFDDLISPNDEVLKEIAKIGGERLMQTRSVLEGSDLIRLLL